MTDMLEDERTYRAHLALHGQPLLIEWMARAVMVARGARFHGEGDRLRSKVAAKATATGHFSLLSDSAQSYTASRDAFAQARRVWAAAVRDYYGRGAEQVWDASSCTVGGHTYVHVPMLGDPS